jgi:hypothetical protein
MPPQQPQHRLELPPKNLVWITWVELQILPVEDAYYVHDIGSKIR